MFSGRYTYGSPFHVFGLSDRVPEGSILGASVRRCLTPELHAED